MTPEEYFEAAKTERAAAEELREQAKKERAAAESFRDAAEAALESARLLNGEDNER